MKVLRSTDTL